jgi:signal transduction histidine kinase
MTYVSKLAQEYLSVAGIRCRLNVPASLPTLWIEAEKRHHLFLAIKETLNNIVKHAQATEVSLGLILQPAGFTVVIADNGRGMEAAAADAAAAGRLQSGRGLPGLKKRLMEIGGECLINSTPGQGTRVELSLPAGSSSPERAKGKP